MIEFLRDANMIKDQLAVIGLSLRNSEFHAQIFRVPPLEYHPIIAVLNSKGDKADFHELSSQLLSYDILLRNLVHSPLRFTANFARSGTDAKGNTSIFYGKKNIF